MLDNNAPFSDANAPCAGKTNLTSQAGQRRRLRAVSDDREVAMISTRMLSVLLAAAMLAGCGGQGATTEGTAPRTVNPGLVPRSQPPIPLGFDLDENKSIDFVVAGSRFANHRYKGGAEKLEVKRFYERQMPINRWTLTTSMFVGGDINMDFEKDSERCRVTVTDGGLFHKSYILIRLWTSGPVQLPTPAPGSNK
jgi:hypothetical protein